MATKDKMSQDLQQINLSKVPVRPMKDSFSVYRYRGVCTYDYMNLPTITPTQMKDIHGINPFALLILLEKTMVKELRFSILAQCAQIDFSILRTTVETTKVFSKFYGIDFPMPVLGLRIYIKTESGSEYTLVSCDDHVRSVSFKEGVYLKPYIKIMASYVIDIGSYGACTMSEIDHLQWASTPFMHYGIVTKEETQRIEKEMFGRLGKHIFEPEIELGNYKIYNNLPIEVDMDKI